MGFAIINQRRLLQLRERGIIARRGLTHKYEVCFSELQDAEIKSSEKNANIDSRWLYLTFKCDERAPIKISAEGYEQLTLLLRFVERFKSAQKRGIE